MSKKSEIAEVSQVPPNTAEEAEMPNCAWWILDLPRYIQDPQWGIFSASLPDTSLKKYSVYVSTLGLIQIKSIFPKGRNVENKI